MKKYLFSALYFLLLAAFTLYVVLDTFVITRVYEVVAPDSTVKEEQSYTEGTTDGLTEEITDEPSEPGQIIKTDSKYSDGNITVTLSEHRVNDTTVYVADVRISSAEYLRTAFAKNAYGRNVTEKTSVMAENNEAILAINGDYYGARESGFVIRNGVIYRERGASDREALVIYSSGEFGIVNEKETSAAELLSNGARQVLSFGPALVIDSKVAVGENEEVGQAMRSNPRTAIGILGELHYVLVVSDGRTKESAGLSLRELAEFMESLGAKTAYNLDGGGSSTMYFNGRVVNNPTTDGKKIQERSVSDIVYIGY